MRAEESRVLVVAPLGHDAEAMAGMLRQEGVAAEVCVGAGECLERLEAGAGALLLTEEALELPGAEGLLESFGRQPAWSELPLIILTSGGESRFLRLLGIAAEVAGAVTLLERPMRAGTLLQTVRVALRSRRRQYEVRDLLAERERREQVLRESEERLRLGATAARLFAFEWDPIRDHVRREGDAQSVLGVPMKEETGKSFFERVHPADRERFVREVSSLTPRQDVYQTIYRVLRPDGREAVLEESGRAFFDERGRFVRLIGMTADITARKQAQEALRQANERLSYHAENTPLGVVEFDAELRVSGWNEGAERIFGWKAAEVVGRAMREIPWICEEDREKVEQVTPGLESGQTVRSVSSNRNVRKDGKVIWCEWYNSSLTDAQGKMRSIQSLVLEVTARKEAEAVLARDKEELEQLVEERTAELRELVGELEHFSYSITHDMRAPLRAMMGFGEVVKELCSGCQQQEQKMFLDRIQTAARRMDLLITDALNYSKAVRSELPLAPVDVGRLLRGMVDTYPELQGAQGGIRIERELPLVMGNEAGLTQCFSNLLVNAVKFVKPGEAPEIRVWAEEGTSEVRSQKSEGDEQESRSKPGSGWVRIWVEDKGIGISKSMLPRVFDMFSRGTSEQVGTGIGLALARKVVERMGGRVGVGSKEGRGSRFWVELRSGDWRRRA